jgi:exodeoxyribonuclease III
MIGHQEDGVKILSWNVNGLRAILRKGVWEMLSKESADVICLQEIKTKPEQVPNDWIEGLNTQWAVWNPAERPGYSGVLTISNKQPDETITSLGFEESDREGRVIFTRFGDIWVVNVYVPNGQRDLGRVSYKLKFYEILLRRCQELREGGREVIICGDINTAHQEIDLKNPKENQNTTGFLAEEREWISKFLAHGYIDIYRYLFPEKIQYTWWSYVTQARRRNVGWRIDYFLISSRLLERVRNTEILDDFPGSDHCPISLTMEETLQVV